jgi:hypothetical protein
MHKPDGSCSLVGIAYFTGGVDDLLAGVRRLASDLGERRQEALDTVKTAWGVRIGR